MGTGEKDIPTVSDAQVAACGKDCICGTCNAQREENSVKAKEDAKTAARDASSQGKTSGMAAALTVNDPPPPVSYIGYSTTAGGDKDVLHPAVVEAYNKVPLAKRSHPNMHGKCAEARSISKALYAGADLGTAVSAAASVGKGDRNGRPKPACDSCSEVLKSFGIKDANS